MNDFTKAVKVKGWQMKGIAERWGVTPRRMSQIAKAPTQKDWDAVAGLPSVKHPNTELAGYVPMSERLE